jgi:hypothetical protein
MTPRTPQCKVFWPFNSSSEFLGVLEDSKFPLLGMWASPSHLAQSGVATKLPDFDKDFEIHSNAFKFLIGKNLMQDGRPMAFESKKLSKMKRRLPTHEKEMWVVIHCFKT